MQHSSNALQGRSTGSTYEVQTNRTDDIDTTNIFNKNFCETGTKHISLNDIRKSLHV